MCPNDHCICNIYILQVLIPSNHRLKDSAFNVLNGVVSAVRLDPRHISESDALISIEENNLPPIVPYLNQRESLEPSLPTDFELVCK